MDNLSERINFNILALFQRLKPQLEAEESNTGSPADGAASQSDVESSDSENSDVVANMATEDLENDQIDAEDFEESVRKKRISLESYNSGNTVLRRNAVQAFNNFWPLFENIKYFGTRKKPGQSTFQCIYSDQYRLTFHCILALII